MLISIGLDKIQARKFAMNHMKIDQMKLCHFLKFKENYPKQKF